MILFSQPDLVLYRRWFTDRSSIGELFFSESSGLRECFILEDVARAPDIKLQDITAIPSGDYFMKITHSPRFNRLMPLIFNEEYFKNPAGKEFYDLIRFDKIIFTGVRVHKGNESVDTDACQLTGRTRAKDFVGESEKAFDPLFEKLINKIGTKGRLNYRIIHDQQL